MNFRTTNPLVKSVAVLFGAVVGYVLVGGMFKAAHDNRSFDQALVQLANQLNKNLPMTVDHDTRWDTSVPGPGNKFTYVYSTPNLGKDELDVTTLQKTLRPKIITNYKTSKEMKPFRDRGVELHYRYMDKNGEYVFEIVVTPNDF